MLEQTIMAGSGGQGILFAGELLAYAAMLEGREVVWLPAYGAEMRGGTASCTIVISTKRVNSPVVPNPSSMLIMNRPSLDKFETAILRQGLVVMNSTLVDRSLERTDLRLVEVPATRIAEEIGSVRAANLVALGAFVGATHVVTPESVLHALRMKLPDSRGQLRTINATAFERGLTFGKLASPPN